MSWFSNYNYNYHYHCYYENTIRNYHYPRPRHHAQG
jgi:hypothetical protein